MHEHSHIAHTLRSSEEEGPLSFGFLAGMAEPETKRRRGDGDEDGEVGTGGGHGLGSLTGIGAVQHAFHFLNGPADVLRASTANRRWRELACADVVWRAKAVREGIEEKVDAFEVALPSVATAVVCGSCGGEGLGSDRCTQSTSSSSDATARHEAYM